MGATEIGRPAIRIVTSLVFGFLVAAPPAAAFDAKSIGNVPPQTATIGGETGLQKLIAACPSLGAQIETFALRDLGEAFPDERESAHIRLIVIAASFIAAKNPPAARRFAEDAVAAGADREDLAEIIYRTAVRGGIAKAMETMHILSDLIIERPTARRAATGGES